MNYPLDLCIHGDYVVVFGQSNGCWFHFYDRHSGEYRYSCVRQGRGPGEIVNGVQMLEDNDNLLIYDESSMELSSFEIVGDEGRLYVNFIDDKLLSSSGKPVRRVWKLGEDKYLVDGQVGVLNDSQGRFQLLSGNIVSSAYNEFPVDDRTERRAFLSSVLEISPDRSKFVNATLFGGILETFAIKGNNITRRACRMFYPPEIEFASGVVRHKPGMKWGFSSLCVSDDLIYGVFLDSSSPDKFNNISLFDWNGRELVRYETDYDILRICRTEDEPHRIYAIIVRDMEYYIAYIDMPQNVNSML